jgi:hypothetical protein
MFSLLALTAVSMRSHHHEKHEAPKLTTNLKLSVLHELRGRTVKPAANAEADMRAMPSSIEQSSLTL